MADENKIENTHQNDFINIGKPYHDGDAVLDAGVITPTDETKPIEDVSEHVDVAPSSVDDAAGIDVAADGVPPADAVAVDATAVMPPVDAVDDADKVIEESAKKGGKKVIGIVVAIIVIAAIAIGAVFALQPATSGGDATSESSMSVSSDVSDKSKSSSAAVSSASASSSLSASSASASASSASAASGEASSGVTSPEPVESGNGNGGGNTQSATESNGGGNGDGNAGSGATSGGNTAPAASQPAHEHNWVPIYQDVQVGEEPIYEEHEVVVVSDGSTFNTSYEAADYIGSKGRGSNLSYSVQWQRVQVGSNPIYESQVVGYQCSGCGATK